MHRSGFLAAAAALAAVVVVAWVFWPQGTPDTTPGTQTRVDDGARGVTFQAVLAAATDDVLTFEVTLDTHTVDLSSYDWQGGIVLRDPGGQETAADAATGATDSTSHHVQVTIRFARPGGDTAFLVAKDLAGVPERVLEFDL